jgi:hypothetical protein
VKGGEFLNLVFGSRFVGSRSVGFDIEVDSFSLTLSISLTLQGIGIGKVSRNCVSILTNPIINPGSEPDVNNSISFS